MASVDDLPNTAAPLAAAEPPSGPGPWAEALLWLSRHHQQERSLASLLAGQQVSGALQPEQVLRALREAGFQAELMQRPVAGLSPLLLPALLPQADGGVAVLLQRQGQGDQARCECLLFLPGQDGPLTEWLGEPALQARCSGPVLVAAPTLLVQPPLQGQDAAETALLRDPSAHWLWGTMRRFVPYYRGALLAALLSNTLMLVTGTLTSVIYDKVIPHQAFVTLWALAIAGGLALLFDLTARQLRGYLIDLASRKADLLVGVTLFRQSLGVRMEHRPESAGAFAHMVGQIEMVREFFSSATLSAISDLPFIIIFIAMTFVMAGPLGWVLVVAVPLILGAAVLIQATLRRSTTAHMRKQADLHGLLVEAVEGVEDIKATGAQGRFLHAYEQSAATAAQSQLRTRAMTNWTMNLSMVSQQLVTLVMLVWGVYLIEAKVISAGALMGGVMFAMRAIAPLTSVVMLTTRYQGARAAMRALDTVMAKPVEREADRRYVPMGKVSGRIALRDVGFAYPATGEGAKSPPKVLQGVTLRFEPGERVAILGRIGSGKSTVLRLLAGLYRPIDGLVEVDGLDLRQVDPTDFRAGVAYVPQDPRLFNGTLRDNVLLGRAAADAGKLAAVARLTGLARVAESHPMGWDLPVGESGALLSGGQRQLVALTRSLITEPRILLMDEPTSSMDAQSEVAFLRQLKEAAGHCTLVVVTHRPAVLELVDRIVVIDAGKLVMDGPKAQVLAALSGAKPAAQAAPGAAQASAEPAPSNVHRHPSTQPADSQAAV